MNYSKEELNEAYKRLPPELKEAFFSADITDSINNIGRTYSLHIDQIGELDSETGLVLLGLTHPTDFVNNLTTRLGISRVVASQVAAEINDKIFLKVRELLKDVRKEEHPTKDALLQAIENPEGTAAKPVIPPVQNTASADILTQKMTGQVDIPAVKSTTDPYREQI